MKLYIIWKIRSHDYVVKIHIYYEKLEAMAICGEIIHAHIYLYIYLWKIRSHDYVLICTMYFNCASQKEFCETVKTIPICM